MFQNSIERAVNHTADTYQQDLSSRGNVYYIAILTSNCSWPRHHSAGGKRRRWLDRIITVRARCWSRGQNFIPHFSSNHLKEGPFIIYIPLEEVVLTHMISFLLQAKIEQKIQKHTLYLNIIILRLTEIKQYNNHTNYHAI